jgi:hypothetical protein
MLCQLRQGQRQLAPLGALAIDAFDMQQTRGMKLFEVNFLLICTLLITACWREEKLITCLHLNLQIFSKERRAERKAKLKVSLIIHAVYLFSSCKTQRNRLLNSRSPLLFFFFINDDSFNSLIFSV